MTRAKGEMQRLTFAGWARDFAAATRLLTRLPLGAPEEADAGPGWHCFPLVGAVVGGLGGAVYLLADLARLPPFAAALLALAATVLFTGALHEDGLADTADGLGGRDPEHSLAIMRDSRTGTFGALALVFSVLLRGAAIIALGAPLAVLAALVAAHAGSRGALPTFAILLPPARADGLGAAAGRPRSGAAAGAALLGLLIAGLALGAGRTLLAALVLAILLSGLARVARRRLGGYTGDVLGAAQQLAEIAVLLIASLP